jgi:hypothetical protein
MRKYFLIFGLSLACLLTSSVFANGMAYTHQPASYATPGWVVGLDAGWGYLATPEGDLYWSAWTPSKSKFAIHDLDQSHNIGDFVWGIHGGRTFDVTPSMLLGAEVGYKDLGRSSYKSTGVDVNAEGWYDFETQRKFSQQAFDALLTGNYFVWQGLNLFAKAGVAIVGAKMEQKYWENEGGIEPLLPAFNDKKTIWRPRPEVILGIGYLFSNHVDVHVLYDHIVATDGGQMFWGDGHPGEDYNVYSSEIPPRPRVFSADLVMGGISYTFPF